MARTDKRDNLQVSNTPFAHVLTAYMWSKIPPWSANRLASQLGMGRARVVNWIYHNADPDLETMLIVMAQLNIPISALIDAYAARGVPIPPMTLTTSAASTEVPATTATDGASLESMSGHLSPGPDQPTPAQRERFLREQKRQRQEQRQAEEEADQQWQTMLTHTRKIMRMTGMKDSSIDAMLQSLTDDRNRHLAGLPSAIEQRRAEEFREQPQAERHEERQEERHEQQSGRRHDTPLSR
jgi:hypothetical protein